MRIITVSRQFGSGGRELGKRLADLLRCDYYDREIIQALAEEQGMHPDEVRRALNTHGWDHYQLTYRHSFDQAVRMHRGGAGAELMARQREILQEIAESGNDCVIVGRDADVILQEKHPFRVFVCAETQARLERCLRYERKRPPEEQLTEKKILRNIRRIDHNRRVFREVVTGRIAGDGSTFDLTVNATGWEIKKLAEAVAEFSGRWFEQHEQE